MTVIFCYASSYVGMVRCGVCQKEKKKFYITSLRALCNQELLSLFYFTLDSTCCMFRLTLSTTLVHFIKKVFRFRLLRALIRLLMIGARESDLIFGISATCMHTYMSGTFPFAVKSFTRRIR